MRRSEGQLPHYIQIDFNGSRPKLDHLQLLLDHERDESYTPCEIVILAGDHASRLLEYRQWSRLEASGWIQISLVQE